MLVLPADFTPASMPCALGSWGGGELVLRRLQRADGHSLLAFFHSHTEETRYRRYGFPNYEMSPAQAEALAAIDQTRNAALAITERIGAMERIVAVGRFSRDEPGCNAELAFVTHEKRRGQGLATILLGALFAAAREQGIQLFHAQTQEDNYAMLGIFLRAGAYIQPIPGTQSVEIQIPVSPAEPPAPKKRRRWGKVVKSR
jgi:RimJ/RimL family protein N-acetyltransferase